MLGNTIIKPGKNPNNNMQYSYRWWGIYDAQRNSNVKGNKDYVQTNMIWGQQWDAMLRFLGEDQATSIILGSQSGVLKSGEATYNNNLKDEMNNIYDLRRNARDWTTEAAINYRIAYGGYLDSQIPVTSNRHQLLPVSYRSDYR